MEVFIKGPPPRVSDSQFSNFIRPILADLNIHDWQCDKPKQRAFAFLTFLNVKDGERFLALHGQEQHARPSIMYFWRVITVLPQQQATRFPGSQELRDGGKGEAQDQEDDSTGRIAQRNQEQQQST